MFILNPKSPIPLYQQLSDHYKNMIINGELSVGEKLPAMDECSKMYECSKITANNAYKRLQQQGYVEVRKKGYYVSVSPQAVIANVKAQIAALMTEAKRVGATDEDIDEILDIVVYGEI